MARRYPIAELAACGAVTETEVEPRERGGESVRRVRYVWRPTALVATQLQRNFEIEVLATITSGGERRFRDGDSARIYIARGYAAGVALLDRLRGFTREQRIKYRAPIFVYQYVLETHAHLDCNFLSKKQLVIKRGSRGKGRSRNVLPPDLGYSASGRGPRRTIDRLLEEGAAAAREAIGRQPSVAEKISYGLLAAARRNPLERRVPERRGDVRRALFDTDAIIAAPGRQLVFQVKDRLYRLIDRHLDEPQAEFNEWFFPGGGRNLRRAIARQPNRPGGVLSNEEVTGTLLHLAWNAYGLLSEGLGVFGQAFLAALPQPLSRKERTRFDLWMMPHRYFGGLPRVLLMERVEFLKPVLSALSAEPNNPELVGALHRLIAWYPEMVRERREADRLNKQRGPKRKGRQLTGQQDLLDADLTDSGQFEGRHRQQRRNTDRRSEK
jgi:hypothetical protein